MTTLREGAFELAAFVVGIVLILLTPFSVVMHVLGAHKFELPVVLLAISLIVGAIFAFFGRIAAAFGLVKSATIKLPGGAEIDLDGKDGTNGN